MGFPDFVDFRGKIWIFEFFLPVLGLKTPSNLFLDLLPWIWVPGKPQTVLPGSFYGLGCSKIGFSNGRDPDANRIPPFRALINASPMKR